jgi:hypothetical protein
MCQSVILTAVKSQKIRLYSLKRYCGILLHRLAVLDGAASASLLVLLADIIGNVLPLLEVDDKQAFKEFILQESSVVKTKMCDITIPATVNEGTNDSVQIHRTKM